MIILGSQRRIAKKTLQATASSNKDIKHILLIINDTYLFSCWEKMSVLEFLLREISNLARVRKSCLPPRSSPQPRKCHDHPTQWISWNPMSQYQFLLLHLHFLTLIAIKSSLFCHKYIWNPCPSLPLGPCPLRPGHHWFCCGWVQLPPDRALSSLNLL